MRACWAAAALCVVACSDKTDPRKVAGSLTGSAGSAGAADATAPTKRREDLAKLAFPLAASIEVPADAIVTNDREERRDKYGLTYQAPIAKIARGEGSLDIAPDVEYGHAPTTLDADLERERRRQPFAQRQGAGGAWAVAYPWSEGDCEVRGWSPKTQLICRASAIKVPCGEVAWMLDACITLEPSGPALDPPRREIRGRSVDLTANEAAVAVARALATDDRAGFLAQISPRGLMLKGKRVTRGQLEDMLADESLAELVDINCTPIKDRTPGCAWNTSGTGEDGTLVVLPDNGGGVMPQFTFTRTDETTWHLARIELVDQGE